MILYLLEQGKGQYQLLNNAVDIEEVLSRDMFPDSLKRKIYLIQEVKQFAVDSLGFKINKNYSTYFDQQGKPVLWVVTACPEFELTEFKWKYPFLGELGYKGFFDKKKAEVEAQRLSALGYDADVDEVNAWSTLGWFKDPVLSSMLTKSNAELTDLILHELTHTNIYIADDADFNENLATFIAEYATKTFLEQKFGKNSQEWHNYQSRIQDTRALSRHLLRGAGQLNKLYKNLHNLPDEQKKILKTEQIQLIMANLDTIGFSFPGRFQKLKDGFMPDNTFFMSYKMYHGQQTNLREILENECGGDIRTFIKKMEINF